MPELKTILGKYSKGDLQEIYAFNKAIKALPKVSLQWSEHENNYDWSKEMHYKEVAIMLDLKYKSIGYTGTLSNADQYVPGSDKHKQAVAEHEESKAAYGLVDKYKIKYEQVIDEPYYKNPKHLDIYKYTFTIKIEKYRDVEDTDSYDQYGEYLGCDQESYMDDQEFYFYTTTPYSPKESDLIKDSLHNYLLPYDLNYTNQHHWDDTVDIDDNPIGNYLKDVAIVKLELALRRNCTRNSLNFDVLVEIFGSYNWKLKCYPWSFVSQDYNPGYILCNDLHYSLDNDDRARKVTDIVEEFKQWNAIEDKSYVVDDKIVKVKSFRYWKDFGCNSYVTFKALKLQEYKPVKEQS